MKVCDNKLDCAHCKETNNPGQQLCVVCHKLNDIHAIIYKSKVKNLMNIYMYVELQSNKCNHNKSNYNN